MFEDLAKEACHDIDGRTDDCDMRKHAIIHDAINKAVTQTRDQLLTDFKAAREADLALIGKLKQELEISKNFADALTHQRDEIANKLTGEIEHGKE